MVHNPNVQKFELLGETTYNYWPSVFSLHKLWYGYRKRRHLPILRPEGAQPLRQNSVYQKCKP